MLIKGITFTDIYGSAAEANKQAKLSWNSTVDQMQKYIDKIYVKK